MASKETDCIVYTAKKMIDYHESNEQRTWRELAEVAYYAIKHFKELEPTEYLDDGR